MKVSIKVSMANLYPCLEEGWIILRSLARLLMIYAGEGCPYHQVPKLVPNFRLDPGLTPRHFLKDSGFSSISSTHNQDAKPGTELTDLVG